MPIQPLEEEITEDREAEQRDLDREAISFGEGIDGPAENGDSCEGVETHEPD